MKLRCFLVVLCLVIAFSSVPKSSLFADGVNAHSIWGDYTIYVTEDYKFDATQKKYPIRNMIDNDVSTAWVHEGWIFGDTLMPMPKSEFNHGIGTEIKIVFDGPEYHFNRIGIVNGYGGSDQAYHKYNRITKLQVTIEGDVHVYQLLEKKEMQFIDLKSLHLLEDVTLTILEVAVGALDDLCISEIQFQNSMNESAVPTPVDYFSKYCSVGGCGCFGIDYNYIIPTGNYINTIVLEATEYYELDNGEVQSVTAFEHHIHNDYIALMPYVGKGIAIYHKTKMVYFNGTVKVESVSWRNGQAVIEVADNETIIINLKSK